MEIKIATPVAILGFGVEGQYALEFLKERGITDVTVLDEKKDPNAFADLSRFKTLIRSPGVRYKHPEVQKALASGAHLTSLTKLTFTAARDRLTAITGSNGKTTTTAITAAVLRQKYGDRLIVGGNDGQPVLCEVLARPNDPVLLEVSSFQLMDCETSPHIGAITNITPNHFDWHEDMAEYAGAKGNLWKHQKKSDWFVANAADSLVVKMAQQMPGQIVWINQKSNDTWANLPIKTHPDNSKIAAAIGRIHGVPEAQIAEALHNFKGVSQRLEFVREVNGIRFYNDSSCTTPASVEVVLQNFPAQKLIILLGGSSKNADFGPLAESLTQKGVRTYIYGVEGPRIAQALKAAGGQSLILSHNTSKNFEAIIHDVHQKARPGDILVLSPACASFDMFKNSKERGRLFDEIVKKL